MSVNAENSNVSIRVREEIYENQRWRFKPRGFCSRLLPTDRFQHSNEDGTKDREPELIELPYNGWRWKGDWKIERAFKGRDLVEGWMYATDFPTAFSAKKHWRHWVRRRKWYRIREISSFENNHNSTSNDWAVGINGHIYFRNNVIRSKPERDQPDSEWTSLGKARIASKLYYACQLAVSASGTPFVVTKTGGLLFRVGISSSNHFGTSWVSANCPPGGMFQVSVGLDSLWAITSDWKCWTLNRKLGDILFPRGGNGDDVSTKDKRTEFQFEWVEIPGRMQAIAVSKNDEIILGIGTEKNVLYRTEVTQAHSSGRSWSEVLPLILNDENDGKWSMWCIPSILTFSTQKYKEQQETERNLVELQIVEKINQSETELNSSNTTTIPQVPLLNADTNTNFVPPDPDNNVPEFISTGKSIDDLKFYHPLSQGFQPGSEILIEVLIHPDAEQFEINFNGKESKSTMYQFKSKLDAKVVSRNSQDGQNGSWGVEETESKYPFPFKRGRTFTLSFVCEESQFYTVVKFSQRSNSAFSYTHRFPIEDIGHLAVMGDVDVIGVRCDRVNSIIGGKYTEFLIYPEAYPLGSTNASAATYVDDIKSEYLGHRATSSSFGIPSYYSELKRGSDLLMNCNGGGEQQDSVCRQVIYLLLTRELRFQLEIEVAKLRNSGEDGPDDPCKKNVLLAFLANNETMKLLETASDRPPGNIDLDKWLVYTQVQCEYPWRAKLLSAFPPLLTSILELQKQGLLTAKKMRDLWFGADRLVDCFAGIIQTVHPELHALCEIDYLKKICITLGQLKDLFSPVIGQYIVFKINRAVQRRAINSFNRITASYHSAMEQDDVQASAKIGRALILEFKKGLELLDSSLKESLGIDFFKSTYQIYDAKLANVVRPLARRNSLRSTSRESGYESGLDGNGHKDLSTNQMFQLYVVVKQFAEESSELSPSASKNLNISENYHLWFYFCVHQWLNITWNQVTNLIQKSIQLDKLRLDDCGAKVKFSSSAIDSAGIFHQIYTSFWKQLSWPQTEDELEFITKIVDDIGRCIMYYAEVVCTTVEKMNKTSTDSNASTSAFEISTEFCLAISNIEYLLDAIKPFTSKLEIEKVFENFEARHGPAVAEQCRQTISAVMANATVIINKKIGDILDTVGPQMEPVISRLVEKLFSPETGNPVVPHLDSRERRNALETYLGSNLQRLVQTMPAKNLNKILNVIWEICLVAVKKEIEGAVEKWKGPEYFQRILSIIHFNQEFLGLVDPSVLKKFGDGFAGSNSKTEVVINEIQDLVELHGSSTENLILKYTLERYKFQKQDGIENNGMVTFRAAYFEDNETLQIEILNCYKLKTSKKNGADVLSDPYIKVEIVPLELYRQVPSKDTHVEKETDCPLFDVTFNTELAQDQMIQGGLISFSVYYVRPITPKFVGEAFIPLERIPRLKSMSSNAESTANQKFKDLPQQRIPLTKLKSYLAQVTQLNDPLTVILESIDHRPGVGKKFIKREKQKQHISSSRSENNTGSKNVELDTISCNSQVSTLSTSSSGSNLEKKKRRGFKILKVLKSKLKSA